MFAVVDFQNLKVVHFKKFFWWRTCQGKKNGHTNYMLNYRMKDLSFQSIHFLVIWLLIIENVYGLIWASYSSHKMCMKEENNREETIKVSDDLNKIFVGLKVLKKSYLKIGKEIKDHMHHFCPYSCPVLQCITKAYFACSIALIW